MPYITHKGSMPILARKFSMASERTSEAGPEKPPKGFKSLSEIPLPQHYVHHDTNDTKTQTDDHI